MPTQLQDRTAASRHALGYSSCALAGCFWGMGFYFGKIALTQLSVGHMVLYRFLFACAGLLPVMRVPRFSRRQWILLLTASFLGIPLQFMLQFYGLSLTTVSHAALMVGTMPVILAVGATIFTHERLDRKGWAALFTSTCGVALIVLGGSHAASASGDHPTLTGDLLVIVSLVIALGWILLNQRLMAEGQSPLSVTAWGLFTGMIMLAVWVVLRSGIPPVHGIHLRVWIAVAASGLLCTAASTLLWNWGMHHVPASRAGVFLNIEPALGSILGVELLGDRLGPGAWIGGACIIAAAIVLTTTGHHEPETLHQ
jgi:drug/metabolite transporter (DMT)-like permease